MIWTLYEKNSQNYKNYFHSNWPWVKSFVILSEKVCNFLKLLSFAKGHTTVIIISAWLKTHNMRQFYRKMPMPPNHQKLMSKVCWAHLMKWNNHIEKIFWNCIIGLSMCFILKKQPNVEVGICFSDQNHLISFRHSIWPQSKYPVLH